MQIHLKQPDIEAAIKLYIAKQGINLVDKTTELVFTAGRKNSGISVEISIEDHPTVASSTVVSIPTVVEVQPIVEPPKTPTVIVGVPVEGTPIVKPPSLFGN